MQVELDLEQVLELLPIVCWEEQLPHGEHAAVVAEQTSGIWLTDLELQEEDIFLLSIQQLTF